MPGKTGWAPTSHSQPGRRRAPVHGSRRQVPDVASHGQEQGRPPQPLQRSPQRVRGVQDLRDLQGVAVLRDGAGGAAELRCRRARLVFPGAAGALGFLRWLSLSPVKSPRAFSSSALGDLAMFFARASAGCLILAALVWALFLSSAQLRKSNTAQAAPVPNSCANLRREMAFM